MIEPTFTQRVHAARIIKTMREYYKKRQIAEFIGISHNYIPSIANMSKRTDDKYHAPISVIHKVLLYAARSETVGAA